MLLPGRPGSRAAILFATVFMLSTPAASSADAPGTAIVIGPGPRTMSGEEKALVADPAAAAQHGIILVDETVRDEESGSTEILRHVRAKILDDEGLSLADVAIPYPREGGVLKRWWGFTVAPDGTVVEIKQGDLQTQEIPVPSRDRFTFRETTLPGAVPGCVIDYGFHFQLSGIHAWPRVDLQQEYPVLQFRYRWVPTPSDVAAFRLFHNEGLRIQTVKDMHSVLVTASGLPPAHEEPNMPPVLESHASVLFYYRENATRPAKYWDHEAGRLLRRVKDFTPKKETQKVIASLDLPARVGLDGLLMAAYHRAAATYRNTTPFTSDEADPLQSDVGRSSRTVLDLLETKEASAWELDLLYLGIAKALGAEAGLVLATDRRDHYFDPQLLSMRQFTSTVVAVKGPGEPDDHFVFVDLGSGLPFGQIPWWLSGGSAFMVSESGHRTIMIPPSEASKNLLQTRGTVGFDLPQRDRDPRRIMSWSTTGMGQEALWEREQLRMMTPQERGTALAKMCGSEDLNVRGSVDPNLQDLSQGFFIQCGGSQPISTDVEATPATTLYRIPLRGPYLRQVPRFTAAERSLPVVFPYRRIESLILEVRSPEGFVPAGTTPPQQFESPFGSYALFVKSTPDGYHIERVFSLTALEVPPAEYAELNAFFDAVAAADETFLLSFLRASGP